MNIKIILTNTVLSFFLVSSSFIESIENSIVPAIKNLEAIENLPTHKYSRHQLKEISSALEHKDECVRCISFNMLANDNDNEREECNRWPQRLPRIVEMLKEMEPDLIGAQELCQVQLDDLLAQIGTRYAFFGEPRSDGELNGVFYRKERFGLIKAVVWCIDSGLSGNQVTMLQLKDRFTGRFFAIFNTHLSFNLRKRDEEVHFIIDKIASVARHMPVLLTGDFNTFPNRPDLDCLPFHDGEYIHRLLTKRILKDSSEVSLLGHLGPIATFTNAPKDKVPFQGSGTPGVVLDHIYVSKEIIVLVHAVQAGTVNGYFPSDHMPVIMDFLIYAGRMDCRH